MGNSGLEVIGGRDRKNTCVLSFWLQPKIKDDTEMVQRHSPEFGASLFFMIFTNKSYKDGCVLRK